MKGYRGVGIILLVFCLNTLFLLSPQSLMIPMIQASEKSPSQEDVLSKVDQYINEHQDEVAGAAIAVFNRDELLLERYIGYENRESEIPITDETVIEWGSATKLLTWLSVMQLVDVGKLDLEADIQMYLPDNFLTNLKFTEEITLKDLMNHQAGFEETFVDIFVAENQEITTLEDTLRSRQPQQIFTPGETTAYSNWGTALAGYIVERQSGLSFADYVHEHIFQPLEMTKTALLPDLSDNLWVKEKRTKLVTYDSNLQRQTDGHLQIPLYPAGSSTGTLSDFAKFAQAFLDPNSPIFKNTDSLAKILEPTALYSSTDLSRNSHGFWAHYFESQVFSHGGNTAACTSYLTFDPVNNIGLVVMVNQQNELTFTSELLPILYGDYRHSVYDQQLEITNTFYKSNRAVFKGPLALSQLSYMQLTTSDQDQFMNSVDHRGLQRLEMAYQDLEEVSMGELVFVGFVLLSLMLGVVYAVIMLLAYGISWLYRRFKGRKGTQHRRKRWPWDIVGAVLLIVFPSNLFVMMMKVMSFQALNQYYWQIVLTFILGVLMVAVMFGMVRFWRKERLGKMQIVSLGLGIYFLSISLFANIFWQMGAFWLI